MIVDNIYDQSVVLGSYYKYAKLLFKKLGLDLVATRINNIIITSSNKNMGGKVIFLSSYVERIKHVLHNSTFYIAGFIICQIKHRIPPF